MDAYMGLSRSGDLPRMPDLHCVRSNLNSFRRITGFRFSEYIETQVIGHTIADFQLLTGWGFDITSSDHFHVVLEIFPIV